MSVKEITYYVIRVNGQEVSAKFTSRAIAEMEKAKLNPETQQLAEVVPVTWDGKELLFG